MHQRLKVAQVQQPELAVVARRQHHRPLSVRRVVEVQDAVNRLFMQLVRLPVLKHLKVEQAHVALRVADNNTLKRMHIQHGAVSHFFVPRSEKGHDALFEREVEDKETLVSRSSNSLRRQQLQLEEKQKHIHMLLEYRT